MPVAGALAVLSSSSGANGGGAKLPNFDQQIRSGASADASGSNIQSGTPGDLIVGGSKNNMWLIVGIAAVALLVILRK
jgi:hypothetical protein